jgi:aryl-alcohol dehydrogenase-like predicted oxidoreductase
MDVRNESDTFDIGGDLTVHRLGYGAMRLCGPNIIGEPEDGTDPTAVLRRAVELGVDFIDTSDSYGPCVNERQIREALAPYPDDLVVATKGGLLRNRDGDWTPHGHPDYLRNAVLGSLDRLRVDTIDLYQLHRPDPDVPLEESLTVLAELADDGVLRHVGVSNVDAEQLERALDVVDVATVQNQYNVANREHEDVLELCEEHGIGFIPWYPLGAGDLGERRDALEAIAERHDATIRQVALAWLLQHSPVTLPIPGTSSVSHLESNVAASSLTLSDAEMRRLSE